MVLGFYLPEQNFGVINYSDLQQQLQQQEFFFQAE